MTIRRYFPLLSLFLGSCQLLSLAACLPASATPQTASACSDEAKSVAADQQNDGNPLAKLDHIMESTLQSEKIPGGSLAIARAGRLVYARGFGLAVVNKAHTPETKLHGVSGKPFTPTTLLTIASVSKTVCALAVLRLVEHGQLSLDEKLYAALGSPPLPRPPADRRVFDITVRQLLYHCAGWRREDIGYSRQVMRRVAGNSVVPYMELLTEIFCLPLDYTPGSQAHYSNLQFAILRLVVEHKSKDNYEHYVRTQVLQPAGITDMLPEGAFNTYMPNEAHRYDCHHGRELKGGRRHMMFADVTGSWLASTVDLVKLVTAMDGTRLPDYLQPYLYRAMLAPPPPPVPRRPNGSHFGMGLDTAYYQHGRSGFSKNGGVAGARAYIEHLPDNTDFAILLNGSGAGRGPSLPVFVTQVRQSIRATSDWPHKDLFRQPQP